MTLRAPLRTQRRRLLHVTAACLLSFPSTAHASRLRRRCTHPPPPPNRKAAVLRTSTNGAVRAPDAPRHSTARPARRLGAALRLFAGSAAKDVAEVSAWGGESALLVLAAGSVATAAYAVQGVAWGERQKYSLFLPVRADTHNCRNAPARVP